MLFTGIAIGLFVGLVIVAISVPRKVEYAEIIDIKGTPEKVFQSIVRQEDLMAWSAWPSETGSNCKVEGDDGKIGAQTIYLDKKNNKFGFQEVVDMNANSKVTFHVESKGPPQKTLLEFYVAPKSDNTSTVILYFHNEFPWVVHLAVRLFGIVRWTRGMHVKDLDGLKRYVENNETYEGHPLKQAKAA